MSIISKLPHRRFRLGNNISPTQSCSLFQDNENRLPDYYGRQNTFDIVRNGNKTCFRRFLCKTSSNQAYNPLNAFTFRYKEHEPRFVRKEHSVAPTGGKSFFVLCLLTILIKL